MKRTKLNNLILIGTLALCPYTSVVVPSFTVSALAQEEIDIEALRRELQSSRTTKAGKPSLVEDKQSVPESGANNSLADDSLFDIQPDSAKEVKPAAKVTMAAMDESLPLDSGSSIESDKSVDGAPILKNENSAYLSDENRSLKSQIASLKKKLEAKSEDLEKVRNRLVIAETQVERLSSIVDKRNTQTLEAAGIQRPSGSQSVSSNEMARAALPVGKNFPEAGRPQAQTSERQSGVAPSGMASGEMLIATVVANKANLRTGPGADNSPLMTVNKGTRLAVETRQGGWYRVVSPNGSRAWVVGDVLNFETQGNLKVGGYVAAKREF